MKAIPSQHGTRWDVKLYSKSGMIWATIAEQISFEDAIKLASSINK